MRLFQEIQMSLRMAGYSASRAHILIQPLLKLQTAVVCTQNVSSCSSLVFKTCCRRHTSSHFHSSQTSNRPLMAHRRHSTFPLMDNVRVKSRKISTETLARSTRKDRMENITIFTQMIEQKGDSPWTVDDWADIGNQFKSVRQWDVMCMQTLYKKNLVDAGRSLMSYIEAQGTPVNRVMLTHFIALIGVCNKGSAREEKEIKKYYDLLLSTSSLLDGASIELLIRGISNTNLYLECLKLLEAYKETSSRGHGVLVHMLIAGLKYHDMELCNLIIGQLDESMDVSQLGPNVTKAVETCLAVGNQPGLDLLMDYLQRHSLLIEKEYLDQMLAAFHRYQPNTWIGKYGYVHHRGGNCVVCRRQMERISISDESFAALKSAFLDQVIINDNVFFKSSPEELAHFKQFVKKFGPFDVVIDGLNVMFKGPRPPRVERLERAVAYFTQAKKRVFVIGSKRLKSLPLNLPSTNPTPVLYTTSTTKADDVFFLYAAIQSGKDTTIVSHDKLRDHKHLLEPALRPTFHKWLLSCQICDWFFSRYGDFGIKRRHDFNLGPVRDQGGWHFPVNDCDQDTPFGKLSILCLRKKSRPEMRKSGRNTKGTKVDKRIV